MALVDELAGGRVEGDVVEPDPVAVAAAFALRLAKPDGAAGTAEVPDRLAALALDLADARVAERAEELAVEGQAALDRGDDQVDVVDAARGHRAFRVQRRSASSCPRP